MRFYKFIVEVFFCKIWYEFDRSELLYWLIIWKYFVIARCLCNTCPLHLLAFRYRCQTVSYLANEHFVILY